MDMTSELLDNGKVKFSFDVRTPLVAEPDGRMAVPRGFALVVNTPLLYCSTEGAPNNCLANPEKIVQNSPWDNKFYVIQGSRKILMSLQTKESPMVARACKISVMKEWCDNKAQCDRRDWSTCQGNVRAALTNTGPGKRHQMVDFTYEVTSMSLDRRFVSNGVVHYSYAAKFYIILENDSLGLGDDPGNAYTLGLDGGKKIHLSAAMWTSVVSADENFDNECTQEFHTDTFRVQHNVLTRSFWTDVYQPTLKGELVTTKSPTADPTTSPTKNPTKFPTKRPTTPIPTKSPTTARPTKDPTARPTKKPTEFPTKRPTPPTRAPTTPKPTPSPTTPAPTAPTMPITPEDCPNTHDWAKCERINQWYSHIKDGERRARLIKNACTGKKYCTHCRKNFPNYYEWACQPKKNRAGQVFPKSETCPATQPEAGHFVALGCEKFPNCPTPAEMSGCRSFNSVQGSFQARRNRCVGGGKYTDSTGVVHYIKRRRCNYIVGRCRAIGDYWQYRPTLNEKQNRQYFKDRCPFLESDP